MEEVGKITQHLISTTYKVSDFRWWFRGVVAANIFHQKRKNTQIKEEFCQWFMWQQPHWGAGRKQQGRESWQWRNQYKVSMRGERNK